MEPTATNVRPVVGLIRPGNGNGDPSRRNLEIPTLAELLQMAPTELSRLDIGLSNLVCATGLPGAEDMDIPEYMRRLDALTQHVRKKTERQLPMFRENPGQFRFPRPVTENFFRVIVLVHALKTDGGLHYNPERADQKRSDKPFSAKDMLINGLLSDERIGTCNTIPVVIAAVGRRLGYPLHICLNPTHVWTRWEGKGERFNIEASGPNEFSDFDDDHFREEHGGIADWFFDDDYYGKNLAPADELAFCLFSRCLVLEGHNRFEEAMPAWAKCCFLAPAEPIYSRRAYSAACEVLHIRKFGKPSQRLPDGRLEPDIPAGENIRKLLSPTELAMFLSIQGHLHEVRGAIELAMDGYKGALHLDPQNPEYQADFDRYMKRLAHEDNISPEIAASTPPIRDYFGGQKLSKDDLSRRMAAACERRGLRFEQAEDWAEAQCSFVRGAAFGTGPQCGERLKRVIRNEIAAGKTPQPGPLTFTANRTVPPDPRWGLSTELQANIWTMRDLALRSLGRLDEALDACKEACRLWPKNPLYAQELRRFSQEHARLKAKEKPGPQAHANSSIQGQPVSESAHNVVFTTVSAPVHASVTCFSGSLFPLTITIKPKE